VAADPRWSKVVRDLTQHKLRSLLVVLSIAVGVFAIVTVMGGRGILMESFQTNFPLSQASNALMYTSDFGELVVAQTARQEGVRDAEGRREVDLRYRSGDTRMVPEPAAGTTQAERPMTIALWAAGDWTAARLDRVFPEAGVTWPPAPGEVVLEQSAKLITDLKPGDVITVETRDGTKRTLTVSGFAHDINSFPAMFVNRVTGYVSMDTMPRLGEPTSFNRLFVTFDSSDLTKDEASALSSQINDDVLAPAGVQVYSTRVPEPGSHRLGDIFQALVLLLLALAVLALLLSGFLVVNTISALVTQQTKQIGIMKAVGGRANQIMRMYLMLVGAYGVLGVLVGLPLGVYAATSFAQFANGLLNFGEAPAGPPPYSLALGLAVGLVVPFAAAWVPVRLGARSSVARALNPTGMTGAQFGHSLTDRMLEKIRGLPRPVALSLRNTFLRKGRLALTLTTLVLASAVVMAVISVQSSMLKTVSDMSAWWNYDVGVSYPRPVPAASVEREVLRIPGVRAVESWIVRSASLTRPNGTKNEGLRVIGLPPESTFVKPRVVAGRWLSKKDEDAIVVNTDLANEEGVKVGDTVKLAIQDAERDWKVVGVVAGTLSGSGLYANRARLEDILGPASGVGETVVRTAQHTDAAQKEVADRIEARFSQVGISVSGIETSLELSNQISSELGIVVTFLMIMAAILAAVGIIGLSGTMIINVLESTREIGVMRAVGASHDDIFQVFVTEGVVVGVMAWFFGALFTYPLSYGLVIMLQNAMKIPLSYEFSWMGLGVWLVVVMVISAVASLLPAFNASQVSVRDAIAYE
jgi:putative ABC transport system permease protein